MSAARVGRAEEEWQEAIEVTNPNGEKRLLRNTRNKVKIGTPKQIKHRIKG